MPLLEGAAGAVASQAAGQLGTDAILANLFNPAAIQGTDAIMSSALAPSLAELGTQEVGLDAILKSALNSGTAGSIFNPLPTNQGFLGQLSELFGDKGITDAANIGFKGYKAFNAADARKDAQEFQDKQLSMAEGAYQRNVEADEKRQSLNF